MEGMYFAKKGYFDKVSFNS